MQILIGSNANIGGPATAAAMANARSWPQLVHSPTGFSQRHLVANDFLCSITISDVNIHISKI